MEQDLFEEVSKNYNCDNYCCTLLKTQKKDRKKIKLMSPSSKLTPVPIPNRQRHRQKVHQYFFPLIFYSLCEAGTLLAVGEGRGDESKTD
jgi:hypothetical protein